MSVAAMTNPSNIQMIALNDLQKKIQGTYPEGAITDPNNTFVILTESISDITAACIEKADNRVCELYPKRATNIKEVYDHMSDYEHIGLTSTPATTKVRLLIEKQYLLSNGADYGDDYKMVVIPKDTVFKINGVHYSIFYPIIIRLTKTNKAVKVIWDTEKTNRLKALSTNTLPFIEDSYQGMEIISIDIDVSQVKRQRPIIEDVIESIGFDKEFSITDRFFACMVHTKIGEEWIEMGQTMSDTIYDTTKPTVRLKVYQDTKKIRLSIPQIYFSSKLIGTKLKIEILETNGKVDYNIMNIKPEDVDMNFTPFNTADKYTKVLTESVPYMALIPVEQKIIGGSNGYSFEELKDRVVNDTFYERVPITPADLQKAFSSQGFSVNKYKDGIDKRIYFAHKTLISDGEIVPSADIPVKVVPNLLVGHDKSTNVDANSVILKPEGLYRYDPNSHTCSILNDSELAALKQLTPAQLADELNANTYLKSPYHIRLNTTSRYPDATSYDFSDPKVKMVRFIKDNPTISAQIVCTHAAVVKTDKGYSLSIFVNKSSELVDVPEEDIKIFAYVRTKSGISAGFMFDYYGQSAKRVYEYRAELVTEYDIDRKHCFDVQDLIGKNGSTVSKTFFSLEQRVDVVFMVNEKHIDDEGWKGLGDNRFIPSTVSKDMVTMVEQSITFEFGKNVSDMIPNLVYATWGEKEYLKHEIDVPLLYDEDVFETNNGIPVYQTNEDGTPVLDEDGLIVVNKLHSKGDPVLNELGEPILKYRVGDPVLDSGKPVQTKIRDDVFYMGAFLIDARYTFTDLNKNGGVVRSILESLDANFVSARSIKSSLIEGTDIYFRPIRSIGLAKYGRGDGWTFTQALDLKFKMKYHVPDYVYKNKALKASIVKSTETILDEKISARVSMTELATHIKKAMGDNIKDIDVLGINDGDVQTVSLKEQDVRPIVRRILVASDDGSLRLERDIDIEFVLAD
jgi:hypothetical protein